MAKIIIDIHELRDKRGNEAIEDLATFLKEKLGTEIDTSDSELSVNIKEDKKLSKSYLRVLLRKFLHKTELKEDFRVIAGKEGSFVVKERKVTEED